MNPYKITSCVYAECVGMTFNIRNTDRNENGETIICTDIPHPEDQNTFLWVNVSETNIMDK